MKEIGTFIDGAWQHKGSSKSTFVHDKYWLKPIATLHNSSPEEVDAAISAAERVFNEGPIDVQERVAILLRVAEAIRQRKEEFAATITAEAGFTLAEANKEVSRAIEVLCISAEEAKRIAGEVVPFAGMPGGQGKLGFTLRFPLGVICAITPFNSPLNTPLHKIAPALAAGNSVVIKPATLTPICSAMLCELFSEAGLPDGWLNLVNGSGATVGEQLIADKRIAFYHFTGSTRVGERLASQIGLRKSSLELGSIAATIICADADLDAAVDDLVRAGYAKAGQVCTSTQMLFVELPVYDAVCQSMTAATDTLAFGDPAKPQTQVGPLISDSEAHRVEAWVDSAIDAGARRLVGGARDRAALQPTVLVDVPNQHPLICEEVFGPVVSIVAVDSIEDAVARYNSSPYGLAAGVFTKDIVRISCAMQGLRAGTVHINKASSNRLDAMPFGGLKGSGHGKEGPKYAIQEMTEERLIVIHQD